MSSTEDLAALTGIELDRDCEEHSVFLARNKFLSDPDTVEIELLCAGGADTRSVTQQLAVLRMPPSPPQTVEELGLVWSGAGEEVTVEGGICWSGRRVVLTIEGAELVRTLTGYTEWEPGADCALSRPQDSIDRFPIRDL